MLDNAIILSSEKGKSTSIGNDCVISSGASVRSGATVDDGAMVGMGAIVQPGAFIGAGAFIDAGAVVSAGARVPAGELWTGVPARRLRALSAEEISYLRSSARVYGELSSVHFAEGEKNVEQVEADAAMRLLKLESGFAPDEPIVRNDPDVVEYYKLSEQHANAGLFRENEMDVKKELAYKEAEEIAADKAEDEYYATMAFNRRVGEGMTLLSATNAARPGAAARVLADLTARDPAAARALEDLVTEVGVAAKGDDVPLKSKVLRAIGDVCPLAFNSAAEKANATAGIFDALAKHAAVGSLKSQPSA